MAVHVDRGVVEYFTTPWSIESPAPRKVKITLSYSDCIPARHWVVSVVVAASFGGLHWCLVPHLLTCRRTCFWKLSIWVKVTFSRLEASPAMQIRTGLLAIFENGLFFQRLLKDGAEKTSRHQTAVRSEAAATPNAGGDNLKQLKKSNLEKYLKNHICHINETR